VLLDEEYPEPDPFDPPEQFVEKDQEYEPIAPPFCVETLAFG
jgi:hypothetical protein